MGYGGSLILSFDWHCPAPTQEGGLDAPGCGGADTVAAGDCHIGSTALECHLLLHLVHAANLCGGWHQCQSALGAPTCGGALDPPPPMP